MRSISDFGLAVAGPVTDKRQDSPTAFRRRVELYLSEAVEQGFESTRPSGAAHSNGRRGVRRPLQITFTVSETSACENARLRYFRHHPAKQKGCFSSFGPQRIAVRRRSRSASSNAIDGAAPIHGSAAVSHSRCGYCGTRNWPRPKDNTRPRDTSCRITDVLAVHYGAGRLRACRHEPGSQHN